MKDFENTETTPTIQRTAQKPKAKKPSKLTRDDFTALEWAAGETFFRRKTRLTNPPGTFDRAGRFTAEERTKSTRCCRTPSRRWPYSEMNAARTAEHCAEVYGVDALAVKRVYKLLKREADEATVIE